MKPSTHRKKRLSLEEYQLPKTFEKLTAQEHELKLQETCTARPPLPDIIIRKKTPF